jgi:anti-sigma factor RsiW
MYDVPTGHEHIELRLADFLARDLPGEEMAEIQSHIDSCPACKERLESLKNLTVLLDRSKIMDVPEGYFGTILPRLRKSLDRPRGIRWLPDLRWSEFVAPVAAAIAIAGLLSVLPVRLSHDASGQPDAVSQDLESEDLTDVFFRELQTAPLATVRQEDVVASVVSGTNLTTGMLRYIVGETTFQEVAPLQSVEDLDPEELEAILARLETRTLL